MSAWECAKLWSLLIPLGAIVAFVIFVWLLNRGNFD
jgi:hypothetical protein